MMACLTVRDVPAAKDFYARAFGFEAGMAVQDEYGNVLHGEIRWKDTAFMLGPEDGDCRAPVSTGHRPPASLYFYTEDVDATFRRALEAGAAVSLNVMNAPWGDRLGQVIDPVGHLWTIATHIAEPDMAAAGYTVVE